MIAPHAAIAFAATGGTNTGFQWTVNPNNSNAGLGLTDGKYVAGSTPGVSDTVNVVDSIGNVATAIVMVGGLPTIAPANPTVQVGGTIAFAAMNGSGTGFQWSLTAHAVGAFIDGTTGAYTAGPTTGQDVVHVQDSLGNNGSTTITVVEASADLATAADLAPASSDVDMTSVSSDVDMTSVSSDVDMTSVSSDVDMTSVSSDVDLSMASDVDMTGTTVSVDMKSANADLAKVDLTTDDLLPVIAGRSKSGCSVSSDGNGARPDAFIFLLVLSAIIALRRFRRIAR